MACRASISRPGVARRLLLAAAVILSLLLLVNCSNLGYLGQAAWGQGRILLQRRPIDRLLARPDTSPDLKEKLRLVEGIRDFAVSELGLPAGGSYRSYVELPVAADGSRRASVVWNVMAAPELSTMPVTWCFPVAGCVSYRGYFSEARARRFGERLRRKGFDVSVGGAAAYSTLGWFKDPVLSTVIDYPRAYLAGLIFHELAHRLVYVKHDTRFNESFATTVEVEGVGRWLEATAQPPLVMHDYLLRQRHRDEVAGLLLSTRDQLQQAYDEEQPDEWKRRRKRELLSRLQQVLGELEKPRNGEGNAIAGHWARSELNNADLVSAGEYSGLVASFRRLLERHGGDLAAFYQAVRQLAELDPEERQRRLLSTPILINGSRGRHGRSSVETSSATGAT